jgi:predicted Zn-dependent peptidase
VVTDPATVVDGDVTDGWVNGVHVLVKRIPGAESASTQLYIQGGVRNWGKADAGIEQLALRTAATGGTESLDKSAFSNKLAELGISIGAGADSDYSSIGAWSLTPLWDEAFALLVDVFRRPAMPATQLELVRAQQLQAIKHEQETPDSRLGLLVDETIYKGHPYQHRAIGTLESVAELTLDEVKAHLARLRETSRLLLVVVGDVDAKEVFAAVDKGFGDLPRGSFELSELEHWTSDQGAVTVVEEKLPTNYIMATVPGPRMTDPDFFTAWVAMAVLGHREFEEVRTKRNLSYAAAAWFSGFSHLPAATLYTTPVDPKKTMEVMLGEAKRLRDEPVPAPELEGAKATMLTRYWQSQESPAQQASMMATVQLYGGDWRAVRTLHEKVAAVTAEQIQAWAKKRLTHFRTFVIGDPKAIDKAALESF